MPLPVKPEETQDSLSERRKTCRRQALDLLARREHSRLELERKLLARSYPRDTTNEVLDALEVEGLLEETRFIESFVRARIDKGQGPTRIRADLIQRGIDEAHIQVGLREACQDWGVLAAKVRRKRFGMDMPSDFTERARQMRFLQYRGFEGGQIETALDPAVDPD